MSTSQPIGVLNRDIEYHVSQNLSPAQQALRNAAHAVGATKSGTPLVQQSGTVVDRVGPNNGYAIELLENNGKAYIGVSYNGTSLGSVKLEKPAGFLGMGQKPMTLQEAMEQFSRAKPDFQRILNGLVRQHALQLSQKQEQLEEIEMA